jgi:hypothetical protein
MVFYLETDSQSERIHQMLEQFLRISMVKSDWNEILSIEEYKYNNRHHASAGITNFYANFGWNLYNI